MKQMKQYFAVVVLFVLIMGAWVHLINRNVQAQPTLSAVTALSNSMGTIPSYSRMIRGSKKDADVYEGLIWLLEERRITLASNIAYTQSRGDGYHVPVYDPNEVTGERLMPKLDWLAEAEPALVELDVLIDKLKAQQ